MRGEGGARLRVLLADDHPLVLVGLRRVLEEASGFEVVGEARAADEVLALVQRSSPDVVVLDLRLPRLGGLRCLEQIRDRHPGVKVVVLSVSSDPADVRAALARGASGYIAKSIEPAALPAALRHAVGAGPSGRARADHEAASGLTERELAVVGAVARGLPNQAIARELWVTEQTVKFHLTNVYRKLGVSNRTEAARWAYLHGLAGGSPSRSAAERGSG